MLALALVDSEGLDTHEQPPEAEDTEAPERDPAREGAAA